jgi:RIO kinase 1
MQCIGDEGAIGLQLRSIHLTAAQARRYLDRLLWNIERMLACNLVHADLSPYNVLIWNDRPWIIDLPQAVDARINEHAFRLLVRDLERICNHFRRYDVYTNATSFADCLWRRYQRAAL